MSDIEAHDEFLELCATAASGHLAPQEAEKLHLHLASCSICRKTLQQYRAVVDQAIPEIAAHQSLNDADPGSDWSPERAEARLFDEIVARSSGQRRSQEVNERELRGLPPAAQATWNRVWGLYAAAVVLVAALGVTAYFVGIRHGVNTAQLTRPMAIPERPKSNTALEEQISDFGHEREMARAQIEQRDRMIADLHRQLERETAKLKQATAEQAELARKINSATGAQAKVVAERADIEHRLEAAQAKADALESKLDGVQKDSSQEVAHLHALEGKVRDLIQQLGERDAMVDQQQDLLAHDRDIRDLMGARDLYIAEVYDVARSGTTQKPYGRVFYTKGKSLIFYAYDLDQQRGLKNVSTFQAWGRRGPDRQEALNLGIFYVDNAAKKRWVLKFNDPKSLAQIDAVFVTIEPNGGSQKPSGQPLLFTYLKVDSNHP